MRLGGVSYISARGRARLPHYQYKGRDRSLFYRYVSSPLCDRLVALLPEWVAPNVITSLGLVVVFAAHFVLYAYAPDLEGSVPSWVCALQAICSLVYQTLDNMDGKQARRTGSSSPLGLLFDHGVDAIVVTIGALSMASITQCGQTWKTLALWIAGAVGFYMASWEEYYTGEFDLPPINGPNEGILLLATLQLVTACTGVGIWRRDSLMTGCENNTLLVVALVVASFLTTLVNAHAGV